MPAPIKVTINPGQLRVKPGERGVATVTVRNHSEEVGHYKLQVEKLPAGYAEIAPDQVSAFPEQETHSQVSVYPPPTAPEVTYPAIICVSLQGNPDVEAQVSLEVVVLAAAQQPTREHIVKPLPIDQPKEQKQAKPPIVADQIRVGVEALSNPDLPPPAMQWRLTLRNAGNVLDSFIFGFVGVSPEWVSIDPTEVTLRPNEEEEGTALLTVRPPADTSAGTYSLTIRVFSALNVSQRTEVNLSFDILPRAGFTVSLAPPEAEAQGLREFVVTLDSAKDSNTNLPIDLTAADEENACEYTFEPSQVVLAARQKATSVLRVRPRSIIGLNERRTYRFMVTAVPRDRLGSAQSCEARLIQVGILPPILKLRPQVQSGELEGTYTLLITNPAAVELTLRLAATDPEACGEYRFSLPQLTVPARNEVQVNLVVATHAYAEVEKTLSFTVTATREGELVPMSKVDGRFLQKQVSPVSLSLAPTNQSSIGKARYFVKAVNPRSRSVQLLLEAEDEADALSFTYRPSQVQLSAGAEGGSWLVVRPKDKLMPGEQRRVHRFQVCARIEGATDPLTVTGVLAQVRGFVWGGVGKVVLRLVKWALVVIVVLFIVALALSSMDVLNISDPRFSTLFQPILNHAITRFIMRLPIFRPAREIVSWVQRLIYSISSGVR